MDPRAIYDNFAWFDLAGGRGRDLGRNAFVEVVKLGDINPYHDEAGWRAMCRRIIDIRKEELKGAPRC